MGVERVRGGFGYFMYEDLVFGMWTEKVSLDGLVRRMWKCCPCPFLMAWWFAIVVRLSG